MARGQAVCCMTTVHVEPVCCVHTLNVMHAVLCCAVQITNAATLKKMMKSKKQRKLLKKADTTMVDAS